MMKTTGLPSFGEWLICVVITIVVASAWDQCIQLLFHWSRGLGHTAWVSLYCLILYHVYIYLRARDYWPFNKAGK